MVKQVCLNENMITKFVNVANDYRRSEQICEDSCPANLRSIFWLRLIRTFAK